MSKRRLVITAVLGGQSQSEVARTYGVSQGWISPPSGPRRPTSAFEADQPNETWQADFTHYRLTRDDGSPGADVEILTWIDDCSRYLLSVTAHRRVTATIVLTTLRDTVDAYGVPASTLTDNGMVFTTRLSGGKGGHNALETDRQAR